MKLRPTTCSVVLFEGAVRLTEGLALLVFTLGVLRVGDEARVNEEGDRRQHAGR
jgi:hypothetical protein